MSTKPLPFFILILRVWAVPPVYAAVRSAYILNGTAQAAKPLTPDLCTSLLRTLLNLGYRPTLSHPHKEDGEPETGRNGDQTNNTATYTNTGH